MGQSLREAQAAIRSGLPNAKLVRRFVLLQPDEWFLRGVHLSPPTYAKDYVIVDAMLMPLFVPNAWEALERSTNAPGGLTYPGNLATPEAVVRFIREAILPWLASYSSSQSIAAALMKNARFRHYPPTLAAAHRIMAIGGNRAGAAKALAMLHAEVQRERQRMDAIQAKSAGQWGQDMIERAEVFDQLAQERRDGMLADMRATRAANLQTMKLSESDLLRGPTQ